MDTAASAGRGPDHVVTVFCGADGRGGNGLAVYMPGRVADSDRRQQIAADSGYSETVFVDDAASGTISIYSPTSELPFAGHPVLGTAWALHRAGAPADRLVVKAGTVATAVDGCWVTASVRPTWSDPSLLRRYDRPEDVDALTGSPDGLGVCYAWAFADESSGLIRARVFGPAVGIAEDEATGGAGVALASSLRRDCTVLQGQGSEIKARYVSPELVELSGRVRDGAP